MNLQLFVYAYNVGTGMSTEEKWCGAHIKLLQINVI